jgi:hypothetical protein
MWGAGQEEWDVLGTELGYDADAGLDRCAEKADPMLALRRNEPVKREHAGRGGNRSIA